MKKLWNRHFFMIIQKWTAPYSVSVEKQAHHTFGVCKIWSTVTIRRTKEGKKDISKIIKCRWICENLIFRTFHYKLSKHLLFLTLLNDIAIFPHAIVPSYWFWRKFALVSQFEQKWWLRLYRYDRISNPIK